MNGTAHEAKAQLNDDIDFQAEFDVDVTMPQSSNGMSSHDDDRRKTWTNIKTDACGWIMMEQRDLTS